MESLSAIRAVAFLVAASAAGAGAQVLEPPPRSTAQAPVGRTTGGLFGGGGPADPRRAQHQFSAILDLLTGHDDNLSPEQGVLPGLFTQQRSGRTLAASADFSYSRTHQSSTLAASFQGYLNEFSNIGIRPLLGADANVSASRRVFGRTQMEGALQSGYRPTFSFGTLGSAVAVSAGGEPGVGFAEVRTVSSGGHGSVTQDWSSRHRSTFIVSGAQASFQAIQVRGFDTRFVAGTLSHTWALTRRVGLRSSYGRSKLVSEQATGEQRPVDSQDGSIGIEYRIEISRTKRAIFSAGPSVTMVRTFATVGDAPIDYSAPSGYASARLDLGRTWALSSDWRRETTMLQGISPQSFLTNSFGLSLGGGVQRRLTFALATSVSSGAPHRGDAGSFLGIANTAQLRYALSRCCSLLGNYSYGRHEVRDVAMVPAGFPRYFERNAVRVGMTVWLPLYGTFPAGGRQDGRGQN